MESDEESNVDHFSPQTLLETPDTEMQYSIRSPEGKIFTIQSQISGDNFKIIS